jgi:PTS system fructose-specific IIC component
VYDEVIERCALVPGLEGMDMPAVARRLVAAMVDNGDLEPGRADAVIEAVLNREAVLPTVMPGGVAFPHARAGGMPGLRAAVAASPDGLDLGAPDGLPTRVIVLIVAPPSESASYLRFMAGLARRLDQPGVVENLAGTQNANEIRKLLLS